MPSDEGKEAQAFGLFEGFLAADQRAVAGDCVQALIALAELDLAEFIQALEILTVRALRIAQKAPSL